MKIEKSLDKKFNTSQRKQWSQWKDENKEKDDHFQMYLTQYLIEERNH